MMYAFFEPAKLKSVKYPKRLLVYPATFFVILTFILSCGPPLKKATVENLKQARRIWQRQPVLDYSIVVDVQRQNDLRINSLVIHQGRISSAVVRYWNSDRRKWEASRPLNQEQAFPFTVPGLLQTVEEEISNTNRNEIQISMKGNPPVPETILLGPLVENNKQVEESRTFIFVRSFETS